MRLAATRIKRPFILQNIKTIQKHHEHYQWEHCWFNEAISLLIRGAVDNNAAFISSLVFKQFLAFVFLVINVENHDSRKYVVTKETRTWKARWVRRGNESASFTQRLILTFSNSSLRVAEDWRSIIFSWVIIFPFRQFSGERSNDPFLCWNHVFGKVASEVIFKSFKCSVMSSFIPGNTPGFSLINSSKFGKIC